MQSKKPFVLGKNQVISRRNGLIITLPNSPISSNLRQRFNLKGDNELVFEQATPPTRSTYVDEKPLVDEATNDDAKLGDVM